VHLRVGAGPVHDELVAANGHGDVERDGLVDDAVVLHPLGELVDPGGDRCDFSAHPALRVVHELVRGLVDEVASVTVE
jgi:hypothetical protein